MIQNTFEQTPQSRKPGRVPAGQVESAPAPCVYDFSDYREFLRTFIEYKKTRTPGFSQSSLIKKAGLGENSRGYLRLIVEGKRGLTSHTIRGFSLALKLDPQESIYFENLVYFNQAKNARDRDFYFQRMIASAKGKETRQFELLVSQYHYFKHWYYPAVREVVGLSSFREDPSWIASRLKNKVTRSEVSNALQDLESLGLIRRNEAGELVQSDALVRFSGTLFNSFIESYQLQMMDRAREAVAEDEPSSRRLSSVTLSCDSDRFPEVIKAVSDFRDEITLKFGLGSVSPDSVFQINFHVFQLTQAEKAAAASRREGKK